MDLGDQIWSSGLIHSGGVEDEIILCKCVRGSPTIYSSHSLGFFFKFKRLLKHVSFQHLIVQMTVCVYIVF